MKKIFAILVVLTMVFALVACAAPAPAAAPEAAAEAPAAAAPEAAVEESAAPAVKIGLSLMTTQNLFFSKMAEVIQAYCDEKGYELMISDENSDVSKQISSIENFVTSGCTAIMLVAFEPAGISDAVKAAVAKGVYVMAYDGIVDGAQGSLNLDNYQYGYQTGTMAAEWINSNPTLKAQEVIEVGIFDYPDIPLIIDRANGIIDALKQAPNVKIVAQQKAGIGDEGNVQGENFLAAHPNMQIICGINDTGCLGAYEVFKAAGKLGDNIGFFGADGDPQALQLIAEGTSYRGTVMTGAYDAFPGAIDIMVAGSQGQSVNGTIVYNTTPITIANVKDFLK